MKNNEWKDDKFENLKLLLIKKETVNLKVITDSMYPLIKINDTVDVKETNQFKRFDIVVFREHERLMCHYVWADSFLKKDGIITKSIKNPKQIDYTVDRKDILGKVQNYNLSLFQKIKILLLNI